MVAVLDVARSTGLLRMKQKYKLDNWLDFMSEKTDLEFVACKRCGQEWTANSIGQGRTWSEDGQTIDKCVCCYSPGFESASFCVPPMFKL